MQEGKRFIMFPDGDMIDKNRIVQVNRYSNRVTIRYDIPIDGHLAYYDIYDDDAKAFIKWMHNVSDLLLTDGCTL